MNAIDMLDIIGEARGQYVMEAQAYRERKSKPRRRSNARILLIAAIVAVLLAGCTYAVLKLQDLKMGAYVPEPLYEGETFTDEDLNKSVLSLQGYVGSPEYQAAKEWMEFEQSYVPQESERLSTDGHDFFPPDRYNGYVASTQARMDKIDEICAKYGLEPLGKMWYEEEETEFIFESVDIPGVLLPDARAEIDWDSGKYFESGTFAVYGYLTADAIDSTVEVHYRCATKGTFDGSYTIANLEKCEDWEYTLANGRKVLMVLKEEGGWIIADQESCFISVWLLSPDRKPLDRQTMEACGNLFDFDIHPQKVPIEVLQAREQAYNDEVDKGHPTGMACYDEAVAEVWSHYEHPEWLSYTLMDLDNNGSEDLVIGQDGYVLGIFSQTDGEVFGIHAGYEIDPIFGGLPDYICENGVIGHPDSYYQMMPRLVPTKGEHKRVIVDMWPLSSYPLDKFPDMAPDFVEMKFKTRSLTSYAEYVSVSVENGKDCRFALYDLNDDGQEELIVQKNTYIADSYGVYTMKDGHLEKLIFEPYPETICQGGIIESVIDCGQGKMVYRYFRVENDKIVMVDYLRVDQDRNPENPWFRSSDASGQDRSLEPISKEEFDSIRAKYPPLGLEMKPMAEFPLN